MKKAVTLLIIFLLTGPLDAQVIYPWVFAAAGDYALTQDCSLSFTVGETMFNTEQVTPGILTQGFNQIFLLVLDVPKIRGNNLTVSIFPNPTTDEVTVDIATSVVIKIDLYFYDMDGKSLGKLKLSYGHSRISLPGNPGSMIFLEFRDGKRVVKIAKVQKLK